MHQHSNIRVPGEEKKQRYEKIFEEIIVEIPQHGKGNSESSSRSTEVQMNDEEIGKIPEKELS